MDNPTNRIDPSSLSFALNPIDQIQWSSTRALTVTSNNEALGMIALTAFEASAAYLGSGRLNFRSNPKIFGANEGYGWFGKRRF
ncbi:hypothetical protein [Apibacter adventoris]|uniref:hypothetical protein n=1 Tax=Apibacter adventoris TaxID=1679466 RepID=UPI0011B0896F|nr:hypothetical protein [Apibacter adventoris]